MSAQYIYRQTPDYIEYIEIIKNGNPGGYGKDEDKFELLQVLPNDKIIGFMNEIYVLETSYCITPPPRGYGEYIVRITYSNGDIEMLGTAHIEYIECGSEPSGVGAYYYTNDSLKKLILNYLDSSG